ncbi:MAG: hypothetical protein DME26_10025, partial [Verrucomicrobia bacterium]
LVLLIAAANLANLLLARGLDRRRELATRLALGATRRALARQLALEGVLLATLGTFGALLMLGWLGKITPAMMSAVVFNSDSPINLHPDIRVIAFAVGIAWVVGVGFSLPPALLATRFDPFVSLKDSGAGVGMRDRRWSMRKTLVVVQVAGSLVLLSGVNHGVGRSGAGRLQHQYCAAHVRRVTEAILAFAGSRDGRDDR